MTTTVRAAAAAKIAKRFNALAAKAKAFGVEAPTMTVGDVYDVEVPIHCDGVDTGRTALIEVRDITVTMPARVVVAGDWTIVAAVDIAPAGEGENIVRAISDEPVPAELWTVPGTRCDHCHTRRHRSTLVALRAGDGPLRVIGRNCSADYIGLDLSALLSWHNAMHGIDFDQISGDPIEADQVASGGYLVPLPTVVWVAAELIARIGYRRADDDSPTKRAVWPLLLGRTSTGFLDDEYGPRLAEPVDVDAAIAWAQGLAGDSDFERNLRAVAHRGAVETKNLGISVYIPEGYRRHLAKAVEAEAKAAATGEGGHWGTVGRREVLAARITGHNVVDSAWGSYTWVKAITDDGDTVEWKTSGNTPDIGDRVTGKATVKAHGQYNGQPVTTVTRWAWEAVGSVTV